MCYLCLNPGKDTKIPTLDFWSKLGNLFAVLQYKKDYKSIKQKQKALVVQKMKIFHILKLLLTMFNEINVFSSNFLAFVLCVKWIVTFFIKLFLICIFLCF